VYRKDEALNYYTCLFLIAGLVPLFYLLGALGERYDWHRVFVIFAFSLMPVYIGAYGYAIALRSHCPQEPAVTEKEERRVILRYAFMSILAAIGLASVYVVGWRL